MTTPRDADWNFFWQRDQSQRFGQVSWSKRRIINVLKPHAVSGRRALDAGCGSGFFSAFFCEQGLTTVSLDFSESALAMAKKITQGRARTVQADLRRDALGGPLVEKFDLIFTDGLFEHFSVSDQDKILRNLTAVLAPAGVIVTFVPNRWSPWELIRPLYMPGIDEKPFTLAQLVDLNQRNGLNVIASGGINVFPFRLSPEILGAGVGMLLYTVAKRSI